MTNEEKYKTPEERAEAFRKFCNSQQCNECKCTKLGKIGISLCEFRWLTLEADEEKPLTCPSCGGTSALECGAFGFYFVHCLQCGMMTKAFDAKADAIAAWNRRVK